MELWIEAAPKDAGVVLPEWRWLIPSDWVLKGFNLFGDMFFQTEAGSMAWLDLQSARTEVLAASVSEFNAALEESSTQEKWLFRSVAERLYAAGLRPQNNQCLGYKIPCCFREVPNDNAYVANLHEYVRFMGDLHRQLQGTRAGDRVRLIVKH